MFCPNCGTQIPEGAVFCPSCGARAAQPVAPVQPSDKLGTARTVALIAIVVQVLFLLIAVGEVVAISSVASIPAGLIGTVLVLSGFLGVLWILLDWTLVYSPIKSGNHGSAVTPALVLGVVQLVFGGVVPGVLLLIAWIEIKDIR